MRGLFDFKRFTPFASLVREGGREHLVLADGFRRVRVDIVEGSLLRSGPVVLTFVLRAVASLDPPVLALRRLAAFVRHARFPSSLFPPPARLARRIEALRVGDALAAGASQREIAAVLFGYEAARAGWAGSSDSYRSRVRRLVAEARHMAGGGHRALLGAPSGREGGR